MDPAEGRVFVLQLTVRTNVSLLDLMNLPTESLFYQYSRSAILRKQQSSFHNHRRFNSESVKVQ